MLKNFIIALVLGLLPFQLSGAKQVKISGIKDHNEIAIGNLVEPKKWDLNFTCDGQADDGQAYLNELKANFSYGKILLPKGKDFDFLGGLGVFGMVEDSKIATTALNELVLTVNFATSSECTVQKYLTAESADVYHVAGPNDDTGKLFAKHSTEPLRKKFKINDLVQYATKQMGANNPRPIADCPLRVIIAHEKRANCLVFGKPMVEILYGEDNEVEARLFATDAGQIKIVVEVKYTGIITKEFVEETFKQGKSYTIQPTNAGLRNEGSYKVDELVEFKGDDYTKKCSMRISCTKVVG